MLTPPTADMLTFGVVLALYFSSSGIESLRIGLNRAYDEIEMRPWWLLRLELIGYVLVGAAGLIALSFLIVLAPLIFHAALPYAPWLAPHRGAASRSRGSASPPWCSWSRWCWSTNGCRPAAGASSTSRPASW